MRPTVLYTREEDSDPAVPCPCYQTVGAAGADVRANFPRALRSEGVSLAPGARALVPTGLRVEIPPGFEIQVRPRSGLAAKHGVTLVNTPGTIDSDYRGPLGILMINLGEAPFTVSHGNRIAQLVVAPIVHADFSETHGLSGSSRGGGGFGSTGLG